MSGSMRERMPVCAAWVDALREVFGEAEVTNVIKRGLRPDCPNEYRVFFSENGHQLGSRAEIVGTVVTGAQMVVRVTPVVVATKVKRR